MASRSRRKAGAAFGSRTDIGCVREHNEDSLSVAPPLYIVCDGMGGHAAGEVASEIAVDVITRRAPAAPDASALGQAVEEANLAIIRAAQEGIGRAGMGTTCTAAMLENERLVIAQVGDSRAYLLHQGRLQQLTRDHSLVADLVEAGHITAEEARFHPQRSVITRALGSDPRMQPDLFEVNVQTGDRLLLCSDGLTSMVDDWEIEDILADAPDPQLAASRLVNAAIAAGGYDNVTVVVVDVTGFAEVRQRKVARKTKITAAVVVALLVALVAAAGFALNYWISNSAYLGEQDGKVVVYQGIPGEILGMSFSSVSEVTDVSIEDLQPGVPNRIRENSLRFGSLEEAQDLIETYRADIAAQKEQEALTGDAGEPGAADAGAPAGATGQPAEGEGGSGVSAA